MTSATAALADAAYCAAARVGAAWAANDADAFAEMFVDNGSLLLGDTQLTSREEIRSYMAEAFRGGFRGSRMVEEPREVRMLSDTVAFAVTQGGLVRAGRDQPDEADQFRGTWVITSRDGDWRVVSRQTSPLKG